MKSSASCANCAKPGDQCPAATPSHAALAPKDVRRVKAIALLARVPKAIDRTVIGRPRIGPKERVPTAIRGWDQVEVVKVVVVKGVVVKGEAARDSAAEALADQALDQEDRDLADPAALVAVDSALADRVKVARVKAGREKVLHAKVDRTAKIGPMATGPAKVVPTVQIDLSATGPMRARMLSQKPNQRFPRRGTFRAAASYRLQPTQPGAERPPAVRLSWAGDFLGAVPGRLSVCTRIHPARRQPACGSLKSGYLRGRGFLSACCQHSRQFLHAHRP
jgi:hypothetical protein